jgi:hypothetical protein
MEMDIEIDLEGKTAVRFLPIETSLGILQAPMSTITFFDGNYKLVASCLQKKVDEILHVNPWLGGWLARIKGGKELKLFYDETGESKAPELFEYVMVTGDNVTLCRDTPYVEYEKIMH